MLPLVDVCFANDIEAEMLTGVSLRPGGHLDTARVSEATRRMIALGVRSWAVIHFPEGACARSVDGAALWQGNVRVPPADIRGTAGAGDAFSAGVLYGVHEAWPMSECLHLGVCAAAASLHHATCSDAVGSRDACLALGRKHGFQPLSG